MNWYLPGTASGSDASASCCSHAKVQLLFTNLNAPMNELGRTAVCYGKWSDKSSIFKYFVLGRYCKINTAVMYSNVTDCGI